MTLLLLLIPSISFVTACNQAPKNYHVVEKVVPSTLRVRRPPGPGADPQAGPGGVDYRSNPLPDEQLDCVKLENLFAELSLSEVGECLRSVGRQDEGSEGETAAPVEYALKRGAVPFFELREPKKAPSCLQKHLPRIPVPREVIYRGLGHPAERKAQLEEGGSEKASMCYSSRLDVEADQMLGIRTPFRRVALKIELPVDAELKNDEDVLRLLGAWILTPFWEDQLQGIRAKIVPESLCTRCMNVTGVEKEKQEQDPRRWP